MKVNRYYRKILCVSDTTQTQKYKCCVLLFVNPSSDSLDLNIYECVGTKAKGADQYPNMLEVGWEKSCW